MTRIYGNPRLARRMNGSFVVVIGAVLFGFWELWSAANAGAEAGSTGYLFAAFFIGGGIYGARQILTGYTDMVISLDVDRATGDATLAVWRPFVAKRIVGPLDRLSGWRPYAKQVQRNLRTSMLLADHPGHPRPLEFELGSGIVFNEDFRALARDADAAFERAAG